MLDDVVECVDDAKLGADRSARTLADKEHQRTSSALHREREEILSACCDTEREITEMKHALQEWELNLASIHRRQSFTDAASSAATTKHQAFLKGLQPAALQPAATATLAAHAALKPAALQPPAPATQAAHAALKPAALQPPAPAIDATLAALTPAALQPPAPTRAGHAAFKPAASQPPATAPYAARSASQPAALQPLAPPTQATRSASPYAALQPPALRPLAAHAATNPAATQPSPPASWLEVARSGKHRPAQLRPTAPIDADFFLRLYKLRHRKTCSLVK